MIPMMSDPKTYVDDLEDDEGHEGGWVLALEEEVGVCP